ncbi:hypothetical protein CE91St42_16770 [Oscillospiraceae bacterium]|nr:hypothetical protein CE91St42_16770 [Oscillospiraceae bacterium]
MLRRIGLKVHGARQGLLHDTVEDTDTTVEEIAEKFGTTLLLLLVTIAKIKQDMGRAKDARHERIG